MSQQHRGWSMSIYLNPAISATQSTLTEKMEITDTSLSASRVSSPTEPEKRRSCSCLIRLPVWPALPHGGACGPWVFRAPQELHPAGLCARGRGQCRPGWRARGTTYDVPVFIRQAAASRNHFHAVPGAPGKTAGAVVSSTWGTAPSTSAWDKPCSRVQGKRWRAAISPLRDLP